MQMRRWLSVTKKSLSDLDKSVFNFLVYELQPVADFTVVFKRAKRTKSKQQRRQYAEFGPK